MIEKREEEEREGRGLIIQSFPDMSNSAPSTPVPKKSGVIFRPIPFSPKEYLTQEDDDYSTLTTPSTALPAAAPAHTSDLVVTPPGLHEKRNELKALSYVVEQVKQVYPELDDPYSLQLVEYVGSMIINHLPASHPVERVAELTIQAYHQLYGPDHDPQFIRRALEYLKSKGLVQKAPLLQQAKKAMANFMKNAVA